MGFLITAALFVFGSLAREWREAVRRRKEARE